MVARGTGFVNGVVAMGLNLSQLVDEAKCFQAVRDHRWPEGQVRCPHCERDEITRQGQRKDSNTPDRQRYRCESCGKRFDDLTGTIFANKNKGLKTWILCLYFMGLNLSNRQIAQELDISESAAQAMTEQLRDGIIEKKPPVKLSGAVEIDEVYVTAGFKGLPDEVGKTASGAGGN